MIMIMVKIQTSLIIAGESMHTASKQWHCVPQLYQLLSEKDASLLAMFNLLHSSTNQQLFLQ